MWIALTMKSRKVDEAWDLKAQLVFGESKTRGRKDREFKDLSGRVIVKGGSVPGHWLRELEIWRLVLVKVFADSEILVKAPASNAYFACALLRSSALITTSQFARPRSLTKLLSTILKNNSQTLKNQIKET
jgi:hypothetical protein